MIIIIRKGLSLCVVLLFLFTSSFACAFDTSKPILGESINAGAVAIETGFNQWMPLKIKSLPVFDGAHFKSAHGRISLLLKDGSRVEVGEDTDITIAGNTRNIAIFLKKGSIGCSIPDSSHVMVTTPKATIQMAPSETLQKVSYPVIDKGYTKALITVDDKGGRIAVVEGNLLVLDEGAVTEQRLGTGDIVDVSSSKGQGLTKVAAMDQSANVDRSVAVEPSHTSIWSSALTWTVFGALLAIPAAIAISNFSQSNNTSVSPSSP